MSAELHKINDATEAVEIELNPAEEIARLAALTPLQYEQERKGIATALNFRPTVLDDLVREERAKAGLDNGVEDDDGMQGRAVEISDTEPHPNPVDGVELIEGMTAAITSHVVLPPDQALALALWTIQTHCYRSFGIAPRLHVKSPMKRCGKTTLLETIEKMVNRALLTGNPSASVIYRLIENYGPTVILDEADMYINNDPNMVSNLNSGHRADGAAHRCEGDDNKVRTFSCFAPVAIASIGNIPSPLADRSVRITLQRRRGEPIERLRIDRRDHLLLHGQKAARWVADNRTALVAAYEDPLMPSSLGDRDQDNWRPLVAIADVIGREYGEAARHAAMVLCRDENPDEDSPAILLLEDLFEFIKDDTRDFFLSSVLVDHLVAQEHRPWVEWGRDKKNLTKRGLAILLNKFEIAPVQKREGSKGGLRGYEKAPLIEAYERYASPRKDQSAGPPPYTSATTLQPNVSKGLSQNTNATQKNTVAFAKSPEPAVSAECSVVADVQGGQGCADSTNGAQDPIASSGRADLKAPSTNPAALAESDQSPVDFDTALEDEDAPNF